MSSRHPHIAQRKQRHQLRRILGQPFVADLGETELALDHAKRVLDLRANAGFDLLGFVQQAAPRRLLVQRPSLAWTHGDMPFNTRSFWPLDCPKVAGIRKDHRFFAVQQAMALSDIVDIGRCADDGVHQARISIDTDMRLHAKVPLVAFLGLVHLRIPLARTVLGRAGRCNQRGINDRAGLEHQAFGDQGGVDRGQQLNAQVVLFKQVAKAQDGGLVRQPGHAGIKMGELAVKRGVVQGLFHRWIRQTEPLLQEVDAQHGLEGKARTAAFGARARRRKWLDQTHQFCPRHNQAHLIEKHTLARALGDKLESGGGKADLFHARSTPFRPASLSGFCRGSLGVELNQAGYEVSLIYAAHPYYAREKYLYWHEKYLAEFGINLIPIEKKKYYGTEEMIRSYAVLCVLQERKFDAAIFHDYQGLGYYSSIARKCGQLNDTVIIINGHGNQELSYSFGSKSRSTVAECVTRELELGSVKYADAIITPSTFYMEYWESLTEVPNTKQVIQNFNSISTEEKLLNGLSKSTNKNRKFDNKRSNFFFYARLERLKGLDLFIDFARKKSLLDSEAIFWFYGTPVEIDGIKSDVYINSQLTGSHVIYELVLNPKPSEFFLDIRMAKGVLIFPSLGENSPCTVVEACLHKIPLLSSAIPGVIEMLDTNSRENCLFETGNVNDLLRVCNKLDISKCIPVLNHTQDDLLSSWKKVLKNLSKIQRSKAVISLGKVSVVIPTIGRIATLRQTLNSFEQQTCKPFELIVVDDGSEVSVAIQALCIEYSAIYLRTEKKFKGYACNAGAAIASGEIIVFFDDDDIPKNSYLAHMTEAFEHSKADVISSFAAVFEDTKVDKSDINVEYVSMAVGGGIDLNIMANYFGKGCFGVRRDFFESIKGYDIDTDNTPFVDYRFYIKASVAGGQIFVIPEPMYFYRKNSEGSLFSEMNKTISLYRAKRKIFELIKHKIDPSMHAALLYFVDNVSLPKLGPTK